MKAFVRETLKRCPSCGADLPPRDGEGTCPTCDPQGVAAHVRAREDLQ